MSDLSSRERRKLEQLLQMGDGYVLNFSDRTFGEFFNEFIGRDIDDDRYRSGGRSKAKRLRSFWAQEPNGVVARCLNELVEHARDAGILTKDAQLLADCSAIIQRLSQEKPVVDIEAISSEASVRDFEVIAKAVADCIDKNLPELGLDRLHTFLVKYIRTLCEKHGIATTRETPLHALFGSYVKKLKTDGHLVSEMSERVLKSSISNLEYFNKVRNDYSLAHDNLLLSYDEALLVFNHVATTVRFVKSIEGRVHPGPQASESSLECDIPF